MDEEQIQGLVRLALRPLASALRELGRTDREEAGAEAVVAVIEAAAAYDPAKTRAKFEDHCVNVANYRVRKFLQDRGRLITESALLAVQGEDEDGERPSEVDWDGLRSAETRDDGSDEYEDDDAMATRRASTPSETIRQWLPRAREALLPQLDEPDRTIVELWDRPAPEVAVRVGLTPAAVRQRKHRLRLRLDDLANGLAAGRPSAWQSLEAAQGNQG